MTDQTPNDRTVATLDRASLLMQRRRDGTISEDDVEWLADWVRLRMRAYDEGAELLREDGDIGPQWERADMCEWLSYDLGASEMEIAELVDETGLIGPTLCSDEQARALAGRWAAWQLEFATPVGGVAKVMPAAFPDPLDSHERSALYGWVRRRVKREVERRTVEHAVAMTYASAAPDGLEPGDDLAPDDREALAHAVMLDLGGAFEIDHHGEHGLAWSLVEAATEGRWSRG